MPFGTQSAFDTYARNLYNAASEVFSLSRSKLNEALARGYGFRTYAALCAHLKNGPLESTRIFDHAAFLSSLARLEDWSKASMVAVLVEGHTFDIEITKWPAGPPRRNEPGDLETSYHISLNISEADGSKAQGRQPFTLPEFAKSVMDEKFRVDSGHTYRVTEGLYVSRFRNGRDTLRALVTEGRWGGEAFIYGTEEQLDDSRTLQWIKSSMAKAVLPTTSNRVVCDLYHPDKYDPNARRIEIRLAPQVLEFLDSTPLHFEIPAMEKRFFVMDDGRSHTVAEGVIVDGFWGSAVNSNGIAEAENPTPLEEVRVRLQIAVEESLSRAGYNG
ncbi:hypothetical protein ACPTKM_26195 [Pseudomonas aeruginosa]|uniref:hypothetical protein n=1 Tax=Pseudomonas aeruginosa TaxID=287 RepID=UPI003CC5D3EB